MKTIILTLAFFATVAQAETKAVEKKEEPPKMCTVPCKPKKKAVKPVVKEKLTTCPCPTCCDKPDVNTNTNTNNNNNIVTVNVPAPVIIEKVAYVERPSIFTLGLRGALGFKGCNPHWFGLVAVRPHWHSTRLGLDLAYQFNRGVAVGLLFYPVQSYHGLNWHLNGGVMAFFSDPFSNPSISRGLDLFAGTGLEIPLVGPLFLTLDLRWSFPSPSVLAKYSKPNSTGKVLNVNNAIGNSLQNTQFMAGLMIRL